MLLKIDTILADHPTTSGFYKLPRDAVDQMKQAAFAAGSLQKQLGDHFSTQDIKVVNSTSKTHMLLHIVVLAEHVHPGLTWCFSGEDMMRKIQGLLKSCVRGTSSTGSMLKATCHYSLAMHLRFQAERGM